jgi:uncharacterized membrane protein YbhN (UPF0104 family)
MLAFFSSFVFTATPGKMGEVVKSRLLKQRYSVPLTESVAVLLVERTHDLLAVLILAVGGFGLHGHAAYYLGASAVAIGLFIAFVCSPALHGPLLNTISRIPKLAGPTSHFAVLLAAARELLHPCLFAAALGMSLASWACEAIAFYLILAGFGADVPLLTAAFVYGLSTIAGALSMMPGGIGGTEAALVLLLENQDVAESTAVGATLLLRASTLWLVTLVGAMFLGVWYITQSPADPGGKST